MSGDKVPAWYRCSVWVPAVVAAIGIVLVLVGILGLYFADGDEPPEAMLLTTSGAESTTSVPAATAPSLTTIAPAAPEPDAEGFIGDLAQALQTGDEGLLFDLLHPAVTDRYGEQQCRDYLATLEIPDLVLEFRDVAGPEPWDWTFDGVTTAFVEAYTVTLYSSQAGGETELHLVLVDGELRWFTDCGDPLR